MISLTTLWKGNLLISICTTLVFLNLFQCFETLPPFLYFLPSLLILFDLPSFSLLLCTFIILALLPFSLLKCSLSPCIGIFLTLHAISANKANAHQLCLSIFFSYTIITNKLLIHLVNFKWNTKEKSTHASKSNKPNQNPFDYLWLNKILDCFLVSLYSCCPCHYCVFFHNLSTP